MYQGKVFATAINCMDGRVQIPVIDWLRRQYGVDCVDMITEPGPERVLTEGSDDAVIKSLLRKIGISITRHRSELLAIIGHHDCAGNPVNSEVQRKQIVAAIKILKSWNLGGKVIGLQVDENWQVHEVS